MSKKTIIITGVSSGLGKALFDILRTSNARLICISRTFLEYQTALASDNTMLLACDLSKPEEVSALTHKLGKLLRGAGDVVFVDNAATIQPIGRVGELNKVVVEAAAQTNFITPMIITNALSAIHSLKQLTVVHVSTGAARTPIVGWPLYCATKSGLKMFYSVMAAQEGNNGRIRVHEFDPGIMDTPMQTQIRKANSDAFPRIEEFKNYKKNHALSDPQTVAERLVREYISV